MSSLQYVVSMVLTAGLVLAGVFLILNAAGDVAFLGWILLVLGAGFLLLNLVVRHRMR